MGAPIHQPQHGPAPWPHQAGYQAPGQWGRPAVPPGYFFPANPVITNQTRVRHTLTARNWVLVVVITAVLGGLVGGAVGYVAASHSQQTIVEKFFPNSASFAQARRHPGGAGQGGAGGGVDRHHRGGPGRLGHGARARGPA